VGAQPDPRPWSGQSLGQSQQLVRPAARPARGHGLQALTTRPRGACPLTGRDRDVGRTNQTERSLKEVSGLKAVDPPHSHFLRAARAQQHGPQFLISSPEACAPPREAGRRCSKLNTGFQVAVRIQPFARLCAIQANTGATAFHDDRREKDHRI